MSSSVITTSAPPAPDRPPQGHCSQCRMVWTLKERQGICPICGKSAICLTSRTKPRPFKSSSRRKQRQAPINGYERLEGEWLTYYKVASQFSHKAQAQDREDLLHDIILTLASVERNNGHKPPCQARGRLFTEAVMYRIASRTVFHYWYRHYKITSGLDCGHCSKALRQKCRSEDLYRECPKAIKLESLNKPILDDDGNITELGDLIADDKALDLDAWLDCKTFLLGCPQRLIAIAQKRLAGIPLEPKDQECLRRFRQREQKSLF